jgi:hypothetical protein
MIPSVVTVVLVSNRLCTGLSLQSKAVEEMYDKF